jgi:hypothetical protein
MRTTGMMGVVVGRAAYLCKKNQAAPRDIYQKHWEEMKALLSDPATFETEAKRARAAAPQ